MNLNEFLFIFLFLLKTHKGLLKFILVHWVILFQLIKLNMIFQLVFRVFFSFFSFIIWIIKVCSFSWIYTQFIFLVRMNLIIISLLFQCFAWWKVLHWGIKAILNFIFMKITIFQTIFVIIFLKIIFHFFFILNILVLTYIIAASFI